MIATKAQDVEEVAARIALLLEPDSVVMAFQNGLGRPSGWPATCRNSTS